MDHPKTMKVVFASSPDGGLVIINKSDFDPERHIAEGAKPAPKKRGRPRKKQEPDNGNG